ncbi:hypothetical protein ACUNWD_03945 [Sunxiuqinia sp. A32]|uniref:hypothetical protein n=1 Tax=Sunxiuqinia sp. A32 TaxID=3461496 RepID=UPI004045D180
MYTTLFIFLSAGFIYSVFAAYKSAYRGATHHWGVKLASNINLPDSKRKNKHISQAFNAIDVHGLRDALTTRGERVKQYTSVILNFVFFIVGLLLFNFPVAIVMLLGILIVKTLIRHLLPEPESEIYRSRIIRKLENEADYYKSIGMKAKKECALFFASQMKAID